eukprot:SM000052S17807  [mRNA]  locus=s52:624561:626724:- [translate_table: standard]
MLRRSAAAAAALARALRAAAPGGGAACRRCSSSIEDSRVKGPPEAAGCSEELPAQHEVATAKGSKLADMARAMHPTDPRVFHALRQAKEAFELALALDSSTTAAMRQLAHLHFDFASDSRFSVAMGEVLLKRAAELGNSLAQFDCGMHYREQALRSGSRDLQATSFQYLKAAAQEKGHADALFLVAAALFTGNSIPRDVASAEMYFSIAAKRGHAASATMYGALVANGLSTALRPGTDTASRSHSDELTDNEKAAAKDAFEAAAAQGDELALLWLERSDHLRSS